MYNFHQLNLLFYQQLKIAKYEIHTMNKDEKEKKAKIATIIFFMKIAENSKMFAAID